MIRLDAIICGPHNALKETVHSQTDATAGVGKFFEEAVEWASQDDEIVEDVYRIRWGWRESGDIGPVLQKLSDGNWSRGHSQLERVL